MFKIVTDLDLTEAEIALVQEEGKRALMGKSGKVWIKSIRNLGRKSAIEVIHKVRSYGLDIRRQYT